MTHREAPIDDQDRLRYTILGIIAEATHKHSYIAEWYIRDKLGHHERGWQFSIKYPLTPEDHAMKALLDAGLIEEVPELGHRYRLIRRA